jgi:low temperature requirement protein LtrA
VTPDQRPPERHDRYLGAGGTFRLEAPRLRTTADPREQRHATWFELFFDLVFVAAVSQLGSALAIDPSAARFARFAGLFVVIAWAWVLYTLYANRFDTDDLIFRLAKSGAMLAIAAIAINLHRVMAGDGGTAGFAAGYVVLRALLIALYVRVRHHLRGEARRLADIYIVGYSATTGLWLLSIFVPGPSRYLLWGVAMLIDLAIPIPAWKTLRAHTVVTSHLTERFGTFFIIVLGESVLAVVAGVAGFEFTAGSWIVAALGFVIALCLWWIYFDLTDTSVVGRGALGLVFVYAHFALLAGVAAFGAGTKLAIVHATQGHLEPGARWALAGGLSAFALSLAVIHVGAESSSFGDRTFLSRLCVGAIAILLAAIGGRVSPPWFVALVLAAMLAQLLFEASTPRKTR